MIDLEKLWDHPGPYAMRIRVEAEDIDGLNHTNNAVYVKWCEQVAWAHSVALGLDLKTYRALDRAMTHSEYNYLQASREGDDIIAGTWIVNWDRKLTMARRFQVIRLNDGDTLLRGAMRFACIEISEAPVLYAVAVPALQAYSHSASLGRR